LKEKLSKEAGALYLNNSMVMSNGNRIKNPCAWRICEECIVQSNENRK
jgi:hypothetical protein